MRHCIHTKLHKRAVMISFELRRLLFLLILRHHVVFIHSYIRFARYDLCLPIHVCLLSVSSKTAERGDMNLVTLIKNKLQLFI
jgi:hypothetical protein